MAELPQTVAEARRTLRTALRQKHYPEGDISKIEAFVWSEDQPPTSDDLPSEVLQRYQQTMKAIWDDYPMAYLVGWQDFAGLRFNITPDVLIPRPETEAILPEAKDLTQFSRALIVDVGTGSGAIIIATYYRLYQHFSAGIPTKYQFIAVDVSRAALDVAKANAQQLLGKLPGYNENPIEWRVGSLLEPVRGELDQAQGRDQVIILANLPYVPESDYPLLETSTRFEPKLALVPPNGRDLIQELIAQAPAGAILHLEKLNQAGDQVEVVRQVKS